MEIDIFSRVARLKGIMNSINTTSTASSRYHKQVSSHQSEPSDKKRGHNNDVDNPVSNKALLYQCLAVVSYLSCIMLGRVF